MAPQKTNAIARVPESNHTKIAHLRMAGFECGQTSIHPVAVFQATGRDRFAGTLQLVCHMSR